MRAVLPTPCYFPPLSELSHRGRRILYVAITEYIQNGEPVGSRTLAKRDDIDLSPATIRNELADLEEAGFLHQPHTSSGRVPTTHGFRVFVDALVQMREVSATDRAVVMQRLNKMEPGGDVLSEAGELLSALTGAAAVVTGPKPEEERLAQLRFMPLREGQLLAILVTKGGAVQNRVVAIPDGFDPDGVERIHNLLDELLRETPLSLVAVRNELANELGASEGAVQTLREKAKAIIDAAVDNDQQTTSLVIEGQDRLFDRPEFLDADKIRRYLRAFDDKGRLVDLLEETLAAGGVRVLIGSEAGLGDVEDVSIISSSFRRSGSLGVIGPTRMDYGKVVPLVEFTAKAVGQVLANADED